MSKYDKVMIDTAIIWSKESYAERLKVGAVLSRDGRVLLTGYNGTISKTSNDCEIICENCNGKNEHCEVCQGKGKITSPYVLHAEQNIVVWAARKGISTENATLYITHSPCKDCAKLIAGAGISRVVYKEEYRNLDGVNFLKSINIIVDKI